MFFRGHPDVAIAGIWQFCGLLRCHCENQAHELPQWGHDHGQRRWCLTPSKKENEPHIKSVQFPSISRSLSHMFSCYICILSFQQGGPWCSFSLGIMCRNTLDLQDGRYALCFARPCMSPWGRLGLLHIIFRRLAWFKACCVLVLGAPCWKEKIPHKEIRHELSSEVACCFLWLFFFKEMFSDFPLVSPQDSLLSNL